MSGTADDSMEHWKTKCRELEVVVKTLSTHCFKVVEKHEELLGKYKENEAQYEVVVARLKETEEKLAKMGKLYEPVYIEYEMMKNKFEIEADCRRYAERYASQVTQQNKDLKRQSQMLLESKGLTVMEINLDEPEIPAASTDLTNEHHTDPSAATANGKDPQQDYIDNLDAKIKSLEESNSSLKTELDKMKKDLEIEKGKKSDLF